MSNQLELTIFRASGEAAFNEFCLAMRQARSWSDLSEEERDAWNRAAAAVQQHTLDAIKVAQAKEKVRLLAQQEEERRWREQYHEATRYR